MKRISFYYFLTSVCLALVVTTSGFAAEQPDAGRTLQELNAQPNLPTSSPDISIEPTDTNTTASGGIKVILRSVEINGNTAFSNKRLMRLLDGVEGQSFDLAGLNALADRITTYYHQHNYPFAKAIIPAQSLEDGTLTIEVIEGRYGVIAIDSNDTHANEAQGFLYPLKSGKAITGKALERVSLILNDQPGYEFIPVIRPGQEVGTGDLSLRMNREHRFGGSVGIDNYGNRFTGLWRVSAELYANSLLFFGDQMTINALDTKEDMLVGAAGYSLPLGHSGLRANLGYSHVDYHLAKQFSALDAHGIADIASAGLSYPIIRSQKTNLAISTTYQHKWLEDKEGATATVDTKNSDVMPVALNFDFRDDLLGGGITYGALTWAHGILDLENGLATTDETTAKANGNFDKFNLDMARLQSLPIIKNTILFARVAGQLAADNLDSSEDFGLGGPYGVRAYPTGEGYGDEGILTQGELRYTIGTFTPYGFFDYGAVKINRHPWSVSDNNRVLAGGGAGLRFNFKAWSADCAVAWRVHGDDPKSDDKDKTPMIWFMLKHKF